MVAETDKRGQSGEISMVDLVAKLSGAVRLMLRNWKLLLLVGILGGAVGFVYAYITKPRYEADLTFVLQDTKGSALGSYASIASQFGIELGSLGGSESGVFSGDNVVEFLKSRLMVERVLLTDTIWRGEKKTLLDVFIDMNGWRKSWSNKPELAELHFPLNAQPEQLSRLQDSVVQLVQTVLLKKNLVVLKPDKKLSFIEVTTTSRDELFSKLFTERLVAQATDFYIKTKTHKSQVVVDQLQFQADSILQKLNQQTYRSAEMQDMNLNPAKRLTQVSGEFVSRDKVILTTMYGEVIKNLEIAKMSLSQEMPIIQVVDTPLLPLKIVKIGKLVGLVVGGLLALMLAMVVIVLRKILKGLV